MNPTGDDLTWLLTHGAGAAWQFAMAVQSGLEDADAAYGDGDWAVCVESCGAVLRAVVYCEQVAHGYVGPPSEVERQLANLERKTVASNAVAGQGDEQRLHAPVSMSRFPCAAASRRSVWMAQPTAGTATGEPMSLSKSS